MTQRRGKARKGGDFFPAKSSQPLSCAALPASCFCRLRQIGLSGQGIAALHLEAGGLCFTLCSAPTRFCSLLSLSPKQGNLQLLDNLLLTSETAPFM